MDEFLIILDYFTRYALPPILGGVIGLFTNWLALQMLFHPYKAIYIGKFRLPFTPGIIPKRKESVARALGRAAADEILTEKELVEVFSAPQIKDKFLFAAETFLYEGKTIGELTENSVFPQTVSHVLSDKIVHAVMLADLENIIASCASSVIKDHGNNPLLSVLIGNRFLTVVSEEVAAAIKNYLFQNGEQIVAPMIEKEIEKYSEKRVGEALADFKLSPEKMTEILSSTYDRFVSEGLKNLLASADVASVIEKKINDMDVKQIADLTFKVMNKEMKAVIYLGGLLGALIGVINIFI